MVLAGVVVPVEAGPPAPAAIAALAIQVVHSLPATRAFRDRWGWWTLGALAVLVPLGGPPEFLSGSVLLIAPSRLRWVLYGLVVAAAGLLHGDESVYVWANAMGNTTFAGLLIYALARLGDLHAELDANRHDLAVRSVTDERDRMSRALEEAIGTTLSEVVRLAGEGRPERILEITATARARVRRARGDGTPLPPPGDLTPRHALPILIGNALWYPVIATISVLGHHVSPWWTVLYVADIVLVVVLHTYHIWPRPNDVRPRHAVWTLPLLLALAGCSLFAPDRPYPELLWFAGGSIPVVLFGTRACWPVFAAYVAVIPAALAARGADPALVAGGTLQAVFTPWLFFALALFTRLVYQIRETRHSLALLAVAQERRRIDRDVHDLLGSGLWAIMVKADVANRLPERAPAELADVAETARRALTGLRAIPADGEIELTAEAEVASARDLLTAAGIEVDVTWAPGPLPPSADTLLAIVLREGGTNILRHSRAAHCEIAATRTDAQVRLRIKNDGVPSGPAADPGQGTGNLTSRARALGGELPAGPLPDGEYELDVTLPVADA
jgi:signal transduction histidine kinase